MKASKRFIYFNFLACLLLFLSAFDSRNSIYFHQNPEEAYKLINGRCSMFANNKTDDILVKDPECEVAASVIKERAKIKERQELITRLEQIEANIVTLGKIEDRELKLRYREFRKLFKNNFELAEEFVISCIQEIERSQINSLECLASVDVLLEEVHKKQEEDLLNLEKKVGFKDYYRQYFRENKGKIEELLEGRCKKILAEPWYYYDVEKQDKECNAALAESKRRKRIARTSILKDKEKELHSLENLYRNLKNIDRLDLNFFKEDIEESNKVAEKCKLGIIEDIDSCNYAIEIVAQIEDKISKQTKYREHYSKHILASKYKLKWCKEVMVEFNDECTVVNEIIQNHQEKELSEEKYNTYYKFLARNPLEAKVLLEGECKEPINDSWYFLDENMQTEKCNAAIAVLD